MHNFGTLIHSLTCHVQETKVEISYFFQQILQRQLESVNSPSDAVDVFPVTEYPKSSDTLGFPTEQR